MSVLVWLKHFNGLILYSVRRTQVIDDECDYYSTDSNQWLSNEDREKLRRREEELRKARHGPRRDRKITFDFAGRRVVDAEDDSARNMYSIDDEVVQQVHYGKPLDGRGTKEIVNPAIEFQPLKVSIWLSSIAWFI